MKIDLNNTTLINSRPAMDIDNYLHIYSAVCSRIKELIKDVNPCSYNEESEYLFNCINEKVEIAKMLTDLDLRKSLISRIRKTLNEYQKTIDNIQVYCSRCKNIDYRKLEYIDSNLFNLNIDSLKTIDTILNKKKLSIIGINTIIVLLGMLLVIDIYYILLSVSIFIVAATFIMNYRYCKTHCNKYSLYQVKDMLQIVDNKPLFTYDIVKNIDKIYKLLEKDIAMQ